jgi:protein-S-isoprenylcysteine O-methyltransferase Ste14
MIAPATELYVWVCVAGLFVQMIIRAPHSARRRANRIAVEQFRNTENALIFLVFLGMFVAPVAHAFMRPVDAFAMKVAAPTSLALGVLGVLGVLVLCGALYLFLRSHADLGRNWSPSLQIREDHSLTTAGVYTHIRHPMYSAIWLICIAQALLLQNWLTGFAAMIAFLPMHIIRIPREEAMMRAQFRHSYIDYSARTKRLIPGVY